MRKPLIAWAQIVTGLTLSGLYVLGRITETPYTFLAVMVGTTLLVDGCRNLRALRGGSDHPERR